MKRNHELQIQPGRLWCALLAALALLALAGGSALAQSDATLGDLVPSAGTLSPAFDSGTFSYTASVPYATNSMTVTPTATDSNATITVNGSSVTNGLPSDPISLGVGATNVITTVVVSQDLSATNTYTLTVTREAASTNAFLTSLVPSVGTLSPAFDSNTFSYTASVTNTTSLTVTPTAADATATITVNGTNVISGNPSGSLSLSVGANVITNLVTAEDGITTNTYTLTVTRTDVTIFKGASKRNGDNWNVAGNWSAGIPAGAIDVAITNTSVGFTVTANTTNPPTYTGNLTITNNATLQIGYTGTYTTNYVALGTPGSTTITMYDGAFINLRPGGSPSIPAIQMAGDASLCMSSSTQPSSSPTFGYGINGPYTFTLLGKSGCNAYLTTSNSFSGLVADPLYGSAFNIYARAAGALDGNVTIKAVPNTGVICANLIISNANALAAAGTLTLNGPASATKLTISNDNTVARLVLDSVQQPAGTYGKVGSSADYQVSWLAGNGILTVVGNTNNAYWDLNGATAGAGGAAPAGTWDATNAFWNAAADGTGATNAWTAGQTAVFAAGTDATGSYTVTVDGTPDIGGLGFEEGTVTLSGGGLRLTADSWMNVAAGLNAEVATPLSNDATARQLAKSGDGTLVLSGTNTYTGVTRVEDGTLSVAGLANAGADSPIGNYPTSGAGGLTLAGGTFQYTGGTLSINRGCTVIGNSTIDVNSPGTTLTLGACAASDSPGTLTVTGGSGSSLAVGAVTIIEGVNLTLNPTTASMTVASAVGYSTYPLTSYLTLGGTSTGNVITGNLTVQNPPGSPYTQTMVVTKTNASTWTISGAVNAGGSLTVGGGTLTLASGSSTYTGATAVNGGTLIAGANAPNNANGAFGKVNNGEVTLGVAGGNTDASILIGGAYTVGRPIRNATSNNSDAGTRVLTLGGNTAANSAFTNAVYLGTASQTSHGVVLTAASGGQVTFSGVIQDPTGQAASETAAALALNAVTKTDSGTVVLSGNNTYLGATVVSNGTLKINGSITGTGNVVNVVGGTLAGTGTIARVVTVNSGAILQPGDPTGTLTVNSNLTVNAGATNAFALGTSSALVAVTGDLTLGGVLSITDAGGFNTGTYTLYTYTGALTYSGLTIGTTPNPSYTYVIDTNTSGQVNLLVTSLTAAFSAAPTSGFAPLKVVFTDTSSGSITNRHWDFGDTQTLDTTNTSVTNTYTGVGTYTVELAVSGDNGSATNTQAGLVSVAAVPTPALAGAGALSLDPATGYATFTFTGTNGVQYRVVYKDDLLSTNAWAPVVPPTPDGWTNGANAAITLQDTNAPVATQRFYRVEAKAVDAP